VETTNRVAFDLGDATTAAMSIDVADDTFGFVFFGGPSFADVLEQYTALTGRSPCPPTWSFGLWMSRAGYESREEVEDVATRLREEEIPCDVLHFDPQWMGLDSPTDLKWDRDQFPDPESMLDTLHDDGFRVSLWEHPYIAVGTPNFETAAAEGYLIEDGAGDPYVLDDLVIGQSRGGIVDFTNPDAVSWWQEKHRRLLAMGADAFKTDFGEDVPRDSVFANGETGASMHNPYPNRYNEAVYDVLSEERGQDDAVTWGRSAWTGGQRFPLYWGGDPYAPFEGMASALRGGLSLSLSGFPFWSHDIGGFWGEPSERLYIRWAQFGLLSSHARCHGVTPREPWHFGEEATRVFRKFAELRYRLLPYLSSLAAAATETGMPVVRPLVLEYQDDPAVSDMDDQYMLGPDLLVAPVLRADDTVEVYLPDDEWVDYWTGERIHGPATLDREVPLDSMPLFVRAESIIPMGEPTQTVDAQSDERSLNVTLSETGASRARWEIPDETTGAGQAVVVTRSADRTTLDIELPESDRFRATRATVDGFEDAPEDVVVNDRLIPMGDQDGDKRGWTYDEASGTLTIRL
jgi:alpha-D-xyloside xylohydrolase